MSEDSWNLGSAVPSGSGAGLPPVAPGPAPAEPTQLGRFQLRARLGEGGMGLVFRAFDPELGREVALKVIQPQRLGSQAAVTRLLREAEAMASLRHPGIVALHEVGQAEGRPFLVCELVEGARTLTEAFAERTWAERVELVLEAAEALGFAHSRGFVHRDIKPDNVLVDTDGRVRVIDLGLVAGIGLDRLTRSGALVGTPSTMSPEQVAGSRERVGPPADVWALGVLLYLALCERLPFTGQSLLDLVSAITRQEPTPPRAFLPELPPALEACCLRALSKDLDQRPPDGAAFAEELRLALAAPPGSAPRIGFFLAAGLALVLSLGGALLFWSLPEETPALAAGPSPTTTPPPAALPSPSASVTPEPPPEPAALLRAKALLREGDREGALRVLDAALASSPHDILLLTSRATSRMSAGQAIGALEDIELALELDPEHAPAYAVRGALRVPLGNYPGALEDLELAIRNDPQDRGSRRNHASVLSAMNRLDESLAEFDALIEEDPRDVSSLAARATAWEFKGDWTKCLADAERALAASPTPSAKLHYVCARALRQLGRLQESLAALESALEIDPSYGEVFVERTLIWLALQQPQRAEQDARRGIELLPKKGAAWAHLGHVLTMKGDLPGGALSYEQGLELNPDMAPAWANLGAIRVRQKDYPRAITALSRAVELGHSVSSLMNRGRAYAYSQNWVSALADFQHALRHAPAGSAEAREAERLAGMARERAGSAADSIPDPHPEQKKR